MQHSELNGTKYCLKLFCSFWHEYVFKITPTHGVPGRERWCKVCRVIHSNTLNSWLIRWLTWMWSHSIGYMTTMSAWLSVGTAHAQGAGGGPRHLAANLGIGQIFHAVYLSDVLAQW